MEETYLYSRSNKSGERRREWRKEESFGTKKLLPFIFKIKMNTLNWFFSSCNSSPFINYWCAERFSRAFILPPISFFLSFFSRLPLLPWMQERIFSSHDSVFSLPLFLCQRKRLIKSFERWSLLLLQRVFIEREPENRFLAVLSLHFSPLFLMTQVRPIILIENTNSSLSILWNQERLSFNKNPWLKRSIIEINS